MRTLQDVLADADNDALADAVLSALDAQQEQIDELETEHMGHLLRLDTVAACPDMAAIGLVLEMDQLHPEDRDLASGWYRDAWADAVHAALSMGDSIRLGA